MQKTTLHIRLQDVRYLTALCMTATQAALAARDADDTGVDTMWTLQGVNLVLEDIDMRITDLKNDLENEA